MKQPKLGKKISELRKEKGLTQEELIEKCNVSIRTIQRIEAGEVTPRSYTLKAIFEALDYNFEQAKEEIVAFEKNCELTPNWFQEPKPWVLIASLAIISLGFTIFDFISIHYLEVNQFLFLLLPISIQAILAGNFFASQKKPNFKDAQQTYSINFNPAKILGFLILHVFTFFLIGYVLLAYAKDFSEIISIPTYVLQILLICVMLFPAYLSLRFFYPYINKFTRKHKDIGFLITEEGFMDNSMFNTNTIITWEEIERIEVIKSMYGYQWIVPILKNPAAFINKRTNHFSKLVAKSDYQQYGSPVRINTNTININPSQLYKLLCMRLHKFNP